jgi:4'-phosphopantetheinyl transferase
MTKPIGTKTLNADWATPPTSLTLSPPETHLWRVKLDLAPARLPQVAQTLSPDEQQRADRFRFPIHRQHFIASRGYLRLILSRYLTIDPAEIQFCYSPYGKPTLAADCVSWPLHFNLSHSQGLALYAVTCDRLVGVDLEWIRPIEAANLAARFFSDQEYQQLAQLEPVEQQAAFFRAWTIKEAYLKAIGRGIGGLEQVEVVWGATDVETVKLQGEDLTAVQWQWSAGQPAPGYVSALVVEDKPASGVIQFDGEKLNFDH